MGVIMIMAFRECCAGSVVAVTATDWADKDVEELLMTELELGPAEGEMLQTLVPLC